MRTSGTQHYVAASADGYIADRENRLDWLLRFGFDAYQEHYDTFLDGVGALAVGARTYEFVLGEGGRPYADLPAWVFTHRDLPPPADADVRFLSGPVTRHAEVLTASAKGRNLWVVGGGELAAQFADGDCSTSCCSPPCRSSSAVATPCCPQLPPTICGCRAPPASRVARSSCTTSCTTTSSRASAEASAVPGPSRPRT